ncbi:unnamed protein product [Adineta steineri]|uniref:Uncharacterized protein n=1 Tax=Adineta steineri TaxID=433720 RepID=A0A814RVT6_9BILA|nr:unnamed protein product [Adineta steineri]
MEELDDTTSETTKPNYLTLLQQINKLSSLSTNLNTMNITEIETVFNNITENIDRILDQMVFQKSSMFLITTLNIIVRISAVDGSNLFISQQTFQSMFKKLNHLIKCIRDEKDYSPVIASDILDAILLNLVKDDFIEICFRQVLSNETVTTDEDVDRILRDRDDDEETNDFTRSFWIERKWMLEIEINNQNILFSILPYKEQWFDEENLFELNQLIISRININKHNYFIPNDINRVLNFTQIHHLEITKENLFIGLLLQITNYLLELRSLKIHSLLSEDDSRDLNLKEISIFYSIHLTNQIKKIYLRNLTNIKQIDFLMKFSPYLSFLKIDHLHNLDIPSILRQINHTYLNSLCLYVPTADDKMINNLNKIISHEKLLVNYKIIRQNEHIFFNWNLLE